MKKTIGVYKITSPTNKIYIGSSNDIENRFCKYKRLKCKTQTKLYNSLKKYGTESHIFEIIEECSADLLLEKEFYYGTLYKSLTKDNGLNCRLPKIGENYNYMSNETKNKIGKANKGKYIGYKHEFYESSLKKLTKEQVIEIKQLLIENVLTQKEIGEKFNIKRKIIGNINTGKTYTSLGKDIDLTQSKKKYIKLTNKDYDMIFEMNKEGKTQSYIALYFNVCPSHICRILGKIKYLKSYTRKESV